MRQPLPLLLFLLLTCVLTLPHHLANAATAVAPQHEQVITFTDPKLLVEVRYPVLGVAKADECLRHWAEQLVQSFRTEIDGYDDLRYRYEMRVGYNISKTPAATSVTFEIYSYTGGAHGNLDIITQSFLNRTGESIAVADMFHDMEAALASMSTYSYQKLDTSLGDMHIEDMLRNGTSPDIDNFSSIALTPTGIRIHFQPYQVAPWAAGPQQIEMPLEELANADPLTTLWGR